MFKLIKISPGLLAFSIFMSVSCVSANGFQDYLSDFFNPRKVEETQENRQETDQEEEDETIGYIYNSDEDCSEDFLFYKRLSYEDNYGNEYNPEYRETICCPKFSTVYFCSRVVALTYLNGVVGRGLGFDREYATLGFFLSRESACELRPFVDLRWHYLSDRKSAANVGAGIRYYSSESAREHALTAYYDFRQGHLANYNQLSVGIESLGCYFDFRINAYYPLKAKSRGKKHRFDYEGGYFVQCQPNEFTYRGVDADIGFTLFNCYCWKFYVAGGPYYFTNNLKHNNRAFGGRLRFYLSVYKNMGFELVSTFDSVFHNRLYGKLWVSFPLYWQSCNKCCCYPETRYPFLYRNELIVIKERSCWDYNYCPQCKNDCHCGCH